MKKTECTCQTIIPSVSLWYSFLSDPGSSFCELPVPLPENVEKTQKLTFSGIYATLRSSAESRRFVGRKGKELCQLQNISAAMGGFIPMRWLWWS